jgi:hypothetical protein
MLIKDNIEYCEKIGRFVQKVQGALNAYRNEKKYRIFISYDEKNRKYAEFILGSDTLVKTTGKVFQEAAKEKNTVVFRIEVIESSSILISSIFNSKTKTTSIAELEKVSILSPGYNWWGSKNEIFSSSSTLRILARHMNAFDMVELMKVCEEDEIKNKEDIYTKYDGYSYLSSISVESFKMDAQTLENILEMDDESFLLLRKLQ